MNKTAFNNFKKYMIYLVFVVIAVSGSKIGGHIMDGLQWDNAGLRFFHGCAWGVGCSWLAFRTMKRVQ